MSKSTHISFDHFSNSPSSSLLGTSAPVGRTHGAIESTQRQNFSQSLVEPVINDDEVVDSDSMDLDSQSSIQLRNKEAPGLNRTLSMDEEWCHVIHPEDANKREDHPTTKLQTLIHLVKGNVGTGLLALPLAISKAGLVVGGLALMCLGVIATHCMILLVNVAHKLTGRHHKFKTLNYAQAAEVAMLEYTHNQKIVQATGVVVNIFLIITQFGFCCVYMVFIADHLNRVFCSAFGVTFGDGQLDAIHAWIGIIIVPIVVFCWIKNLETLAPLSLLANVCILISLSVLLYEGIFSFVTSDPEHRAAILHSKDPNNTMVGIDYGPQNFTNLALFFGNAIYAFEGIGMVLPLENKMKVQEKEVEDNKMQENEVKKNKSPFKKVTYCGMFIVVSLYVFVGVLGYVVFGAKAEGSVILNLEESYDRVNASIFFLIAKLCFAYAVFASFMLQFYVPMDFLEPPLNRAIDKLKEKLYLVYRFPLHHNLLNTYLLLVFRTFIVLVIAAFALALPDLSDLIALIGAVASSALALIFPPLLHLMVFLNPNPPIPINQSQQLENMNNKPAPLNQLGAAVKIRKFDLIKLKNIAWVTKDVLIITLGVVGLFMGTYAAIKGLVDFFADSASEEFFCVNFYPRY